MQILGQSHYRITKVQAECTYIFIALTCQNSQEISLMLTPKEAQILINEIQQSL
jgi:hypothetical protein